MTAINTVAPALIAGNAVMLNMPRKPLGGRTHGGRFPFCWHPDRMFSRTCFWITQTTSALIADRAFGFVNFTGSVGGGKAMEAAASGTFTGIGLELGGKDPGYVMEDANLDAAVDTLIDGAMFNSGQCCCGIERIYVHESLVRRFVEKAVAIVNGYKAGQSAGPRNHPWSNGACALCRRSPCAKRQMPLRQVQRHISIPRISPKMVAHI